MQHKQQVALALHGAGAGGWEFQQWAWRLQAAGWTVHAPDLHAATVLEDTRWSDYHAQVQHWIARWQPSLLIGASLGGLLALCSAAPCIRRRILINPIPPAPWHREFPTRHWPARIEWGQRHDLASTRRALGPQMDTFSARYAHARWRDESGAVLDHAWSGIHCKLDPEQPTLIIAGGRDQDVPPTLSAALAAQLKARYLCFPEHNHVDPLFGRSAQPVLDRVLQWLVETECGTVERKPP